MIVKNEEEMLHRCLKSVKDFVDEIIVVDTGSTDQTVEIAKRFGAQVFHHAWEDNFSKHRNQSLQYATGEWFIYLDADEEIIEETGPLIRTAIQCETVDSITIEFISLYAGGERSYHTQQRIFRTDKGIHFEGRIHNRIVGVKKTRLYPIKVRHHGYNVAPKNAELKHERRIRILKREIKEDPENPVHHHYLAASYLSEPDYRRGAEEALLAIELADKKGEGDDFFYAWTHYIAATSLYQLGRFDEARKICRSGINRFPDDPDIYFVSCQIAFHKNENDQLDCHASKYLSLYEALSKGSNKKGHIHCVTFSQVWRIWWMMAINEARKGRKERYTHHLRQAIQMASSPADVYHASGRYYLKTEHLAKAQFELNRAIKADPYHVKTIYSQIELFIHMDDEVQEIRWWRELLRRIPDKKEKMLFEARKALHENRHKEARKILKALLAENTQNKKVLPLVAEYTLVTEDFFDNVTRLNDLLQQPDIDKDLILNLGLLLLRKQYTEDAHEFLRNAAANKSDDPAVYLGLAGVYWRLGDIESCVASLDQVLELLCLSVDMEIASIEDLGGVFSIIGEKLNVNGNENAVLAAFTIAIEMNLNLPHIHQGLALAFQKKGFLEISLVHLRKALELSLNPSEILCRMGDVYRLMGNKRAAEFCYSKSREKSG
jgi:glycosyltransferase involved in cell wall biosynthesis/Tfp pilus assembly protein PilF